MKKFIISILIFLSSFSFVQASLEITEIMYDPEGSDTNREWVEIYNNGTSSVAVSDWYFFENDTYHGLYPDEFSELEAGEYALIVKDISIAQSEFGSDIFYIKSSFSLNNTGEKIALADVDRDIKNSVTYDSETGANGNNQSLQRIDTDWLSSNPTPGEINKESNIFILSDDSDGNDTSNGSSKNTKKLETYYEAYLIVPDTIIAQSDFNLKAEIFRIKGDREIRELDGYYFLNFGDGKSLFTDERVDMNYRYRTPGMYTLVFEYYHSKLHFDNNEEPVARVEKDIYVTDNDISIFDSNNFNGLVLQNNINKKIDISDWKIIWDNYQYIFPKNSYISSKNKIHILYSTLGFIPRYSHSKPIQLLSNAYKPIALYPKDISKKKVSIEKNKVPVSVVYETNEKNFFQESDSYLDEYLENNPNKLFVDFGSEDTFNKNTEPKPYKNNSFYYALGALVIMLGVASFSRQSEKDTQKKQEDFGTIEIIE